MSKKTHGGTRTYPDDQATALQALDLQLGRAEAQMQAVTQQLRAINAQRQQLLGIRAALCGVLGLDATHVYRWQPARVQGRQVPTVITPAEVEAILRQRAEAQRLPEAPPPPPAREVAEAEAAPVAAS